MAGLIAGSAWAADSDVWVRNDLAAAQAKAKELKKDVLVNFSVSDRGGWCIKLDEEIFSQPKFLDAATKDFVLCVIDFPREPENKARIPENLQKINRELLGKYGVREFPTVVLMTADGEIIGQTSYHPGGPSAYIERLEKIKTQFSKRQEGMAKAREPGLSPADRAKALDAALSGQDEGMLAAIYRKEIQEIVAADQDNKMGLRAKYHPILLMDDIEAALRSGQTDKALRIVDELLAELPATGERTQVVYGIKFSMLMLVRRLEDAKTTLGKAIEAAPDSEMAGELKQILKRISERPEESSKNPTP